VTDATGSTRIVRLAPQGAQAGPYHRVVPPAAAIEVHGLTKRYRDLTAVDDVSFAVPHGEAFGILGPNGAGKTTTLEMIEGLRAPDGGEIRVAGRAVWPDPRRIQSQIGVQLQTTSTFDRLSARELLELFAEFYERRDGRERAAHVLALVGLEAKAGDYANRLSGGQQQRLAIALALVHDPGIVFLDEPTTGLDPQARRNLWSVIRDVNTSGKTVVLTTHYLEEAEQLCERVAIMDGGRIIALDTPQALIASLNADARLTFTARDAEALDLSALPAVTEVSRADGRVVLYSSDAQQSVLGLLQDARRRAVAIENLAITGPSLEDVFLQLTGREFRE
jgi:ABC-2 type transport system ATP-binding protein